MDSKKQMEEANEDENGLSDVEVNEITQTYSNL